MQTLSSPITRIAEQCRRTGAINLAQGMADFAHNAVFTEALRDERVAAQTAYTDPAGLPALREAVATYLGAAYSCDPRGEDEIAITPGATGAFAACMLGLTRPGDVVLVHEPFWDFHVNLIRALGRRAVVAGGRATGAAEARAILVVSPGNPAGNVVPFDDVKSLLNSTRAIVILDEVYSEYVWSGPKGLLYDHELARRSERLVLCHSLSKSACLTGWRIGYAVAAAPLIDEIARANGLVAACAAAPLQQAAALRLERLPALSASYRETVRGSMETIATAFAHAGFGVQAPAGGFFFLADVLPAGFRSGVEARDALLRDCRIGVVEADGFYARAVANQIRVCFAVPTETAEQVARALRRLTSPVRAG